MRMSDWSSDVCSSDLLKYTLLPPAAVRDKRTTLIKEVPLILEATREFIGGFVQNARRILNAIKAIGRRKLVIELSLGPQPCYLLILLPVHFDQLKSSNLKLPHVSHI